MEPDFFKPDLPADTLYHIGVSGGKDSTAVLLWMVHESGISRERLDVTFCDTKNEHELTYAHLRLLSERVFPIKTLEPKRGFFDLAKWKMRFPSTKARFCTEFLKVKVTDVHITELLKTNRKVVAVSGTRADESLSRGRMSEWDYSGRLLTLQWRPLLSWSIAEVLELHRKYGIPLNPLYAMGARRVGCWPCIMSSKAEIRNIALRFPERIDEIRRQEAEIGSTFFPPNACPPRFHSGKAWSKAQGREVSIATIDDIVRWSMTGNRAKGSYKDEPIKESACMSGFCE